MHVRTVFTTDTRLSQHRSVGGLVTEHRAWHEGRECQHPPSALTSTNSYVAACQSGNSITQDLYKTFGTNLRSLPNGLPNAS